MRNPRRSLGESRSIYGSLEEAECDAMLIPQFTFDLFEAAAIRILTFP
ncbi:MAG: hypothetical protein IKS92_02115 [Victivallales bacterium]|nr:hypothetical protein [Victivallales bacterium]